MVKRASTLLFELRGPDEMNTKFGETNKFKNPLKISTDNPTNKIDNLVERNNQVGIFTRLRLPTNAF